ncbi:hypothetical protein [Roseovarius sp.]|uniref:hypothetical protein n=1 Tax=Roseovarius sp. TaxID=1486281 RepID=UPI00356236F7
MYLPQDEKCWTRLDKQRAATAVQKLNGHLRSIRGIESALTLDGVSGRLRSIIKSPAKKKPKKRAIHSELQVERVDTRPLLFYGDGWLLHRFSCVIDSIPELAGYERIAHLFAIRAPRATLGPPSAALDDSGDSGDSGEWTLLDWTASPLHQLNARIGLDVLNLEPEHVRAYLVFFCSFLGGKEDVDYARTPFLIPGTIKDFYVPHPLPPLAEVARKNHLRTYRPLPGIEDYDTFDLLPGAASTETTAQDAVKPSAIDNTSLDSFRRAIVAAFSAVNDVNPPVPAVRAAEDDKSEHEATDTSAVYHVEGALVWYRNTLFRTNFSVSRIGEVSMDGDGPVAESDTLPRLDIRQARPPVPLLCWERPREEISNEELLDRIRRFIDAGGETRGQQLRLRGLRVGGDVVDSGIFDGAVRLENVEFVGSVLFDDAVFERSLELLDCRFLQRLSTRNTTVKGAFRLDRSHCLGALDISPGVDANLTLSGRPETTLDLRGLEAKGGFFADHLTVFGRMRAQWARIGGAMRARGLQIHHRGRQADEIQSFNCSHVAIDGPLDLVGHTPRRGVLGKARRTFICGDAVMHGLRARQADLRGIRVEGYLDLDSCEISGNANLQILEFDNSSENGWRTRVGKSLTFDRVRAGLVALGGCTVGGPLMMTELQLDKSLFARLAGRYRTRVGGDVTLSGATIQGDIDFSGAEISGGFTFITGRCGRLKLSALPWLNGSDSTLGVCPTMVQSVLLTDLQVDAGIDAAGLHTSSSSDELGNDDYIKGGFVALGTRLGGGLRFWREDASARFHFQFAELVGQEHDNKAIEQAINGIYARIGGNLDLRGICTMDSINLGRCIVDGKIRLENARIGGNLRARFDNTVTCSAAGFSADLASIEGDADLSGLKVCGDLSACDSRAGGEVLLPTGRNGTNAHVHGSIRLVGMHASAKLVVSGNGLLGDSKTDAKARIDLSLCKIGQLNVLGFEQISGTAYRFGHRINLLAVQVGDWHFDENKKVLALLEETVPFDAGNYIDIEQRLARIGYRRLANRVYRDMKKRAYCDKKTRQGECEQGHTPKWLWLKKPLFWLKNLGLWLRYRFDWGFSGHGTLPWLMAFWLLITSGPVTYVLSDYRNVEFTLIASPDDKEYVGTPVSHSRPYHLKNDWNPGKAFGLAVSYAIPFYGGARPETVRARLNGPICAPYMNESSTCEAVLGKVSPHGFAMVVSVLQFFLWIFIAANLPTIVRRRS